MPRRVLLGEGALGLRTAAERGGVVPVAAPLGPGSHRRAGTTGGRSAVRVLPGGPARQPRRPGPDASVGTASYCAGVIRLSVMYPSGEGETFDHDYYRNQHVPMAVKAWSPERTEIDKGVNGPYLAAVHFLFASEDALGAAMGRRGTGDGDRRRGQLHDDRPGHADQRGRLRGLTDAQVLSVV